MGSKCIIVSLLFAIVFVGCDRSPSAQEGDAAVGSSSTPASTTATAPVHPSAAATQTATTAPTVASSAPASSSHPADAGVADAARDAAPATKTPKK